MKDEIMMKMVIKIKRKMFIYRKMSKVAAMGATGFQSFNWMSTLKCLPPDCD